MITPNHWPCPGCFCGDARFTETPERTGGTRWHLLCPRCGTYTNVERLTRPECGYELTVVGDDLSGVTW